MKTLQGQRVLVVEDETMIAMDIEATLLDQGCIVVGPAGTVPDAIRLLARDSVDAAVIDFNIAGVLAGEVAAALLARNIPFVIITGHARCSLPEHLRGTPFMQKPYAAAQFVRILTDALNTPAQKSLSKSA